MNELVSQNDNSTIIAHYIPSTRERKGMQSEAELEAEFIKDLQKQGYEYINIDSIHELESNLKAKLEKLNHITFSANEWTRFYKTFIVNPQKSKADKTAMIQTDYYFEVLRRDDGSEKNIKFIDRVDIYKNDLQVISQVKNNEGSFKNRYDVSILVNGLPLVHIELKKRGVNLKEAFNQIKRYNKESFSAGNALFDFVQIFVISNGTLTKYYSNSTRQKAENNRAKNDNFAFTITFSDARNKAILDLVDFTKTFFAKRTLLNILTKYCVFNVDKELLVMRPYQIVASERIVEKINLSHNHKLYGSKESGGYIWHSTGSGKTLTSFKTAQLATKLSFIKKVFFVVDRKDLDYQTMKEYDKFQKGAANSTKNTNELKKCIEDSESKIIITTIQKLSIFVEKYQDSKIFDDEVVFIFDECHRSQFGQMHRQIIKKFKKYYIFGFTGTPIFAENAPKGKFATTKTKNILGEDEIKATQVTTELTFGKQLHSYTILNAIADKNVLPFRVEYHSTMKEKENIDDEQVWGIEQESALNNSERINKIVSYVLEHFNQKTKRNQSYALKYMLHNKMGNEELKSKQVNGFNAIFATSSVEAAKLYYDEFKNQQQNKENPLKIGLIYSYSENPDLDEIDEGAGSKDSKEFLALALNDYNQMFQSNFSLTNFDEYYKDVSNKLKIQELDLLIVVNMFLTGFDSKTINTLWVDKNLKHHGLLQAFSRTNRILNSIKTFGNIVCFRNLEKATNESLKLFGDEQAQNIILLRSFKEYLEGYTDGDGKHIKGYKELANELKDTFDFSTFPLKSDSEKKEFVALFNGILKLENILNAFDEFAENEILSEADKQDYRSHYLTIYDELRSDNEKKPIDDDVVFEIELIKQVEVSVEYILFLLEEYHKEQKSEYKEKIIKSIESSVSLRNKSDLLKEFLAVIEVKKDEEFEVLFKNFISTKYSEELRVMAQKDGLDKEKVNNFLSNAFDIQQFRDFGKDIDDILPPIPLFASSKEEEEANNAKREEIIYELKAFFEKFREFSSIF
ncbi:DEAD/DEAH box helicase [Helicobacter didelphidarum]|uniref:Type I restriction enzyme endonuclease subunit n=1 Tax=Helicobacter didelphidarum TaxID=2040648 RepID=A0A3D8IHQ7_9HELI|nr:type I restriction endonuclease subunit R [Helicobacter didelphidarum]RDU64610.1 DEAD/DEAH box helicase [Helicobacter didelphidarum]